MAAIKHVVQVMGGTVRNDLWCDSCNTSGGFEIDMHTVGTRGIQHIGTVKQCTRCDYDDPVLEG